MTPADKGGVMRDEIDKTIEELIDASIYCAKHKGVDPRQFKAATKIAQDCYTTLDRLLDFLAAPAAGGDCPPAVRMALRILLNHVEPGWENSIAVVQSWLDDPAMWADAVTEARHAKDAAGRGVGVQDILEQCSSFQRTLAGLLGLPTHTQEDIIEAMSSLPRRTQAELDAAREKAKEYASLFEATPPARQVADLCANPTCGHGSLAHGGHTYMEGQEQAEPNRCACCPCEMFVPAFQAPGKPLAQAAPWQPFDTNMMLPVYGPGEQPFTKEPDRQVAGEQLLGTTACSCRIQMDGEPAACAIHDAPARQLVREEPPQVFKLFGSVDVFEVSPSIGDRFVAAAATAKDGHQIVAALNAQPTRSLIAAKVVEALVERYGHEPKLDSPRCDCAACQEFRVVVLAALAAAGVGTEG